MDTVKSETLRMRETQTDGREAEKEMKDKHKDERARWTETDT